MSTTSLDEKAFYEERYAPFLAYSPDDLRFVPRLFLEDLCNPTKNVYERFDLYAASLRLLSSLSLRGKTVLDYGCGTGDFGLWMATAEGARVTFLDLSENAVELCLRRAEVSGVAELCSGVARDAADLSCFADASFDIVFGCASLHHTIKYPGAWNELLRVLKPEGTLVLTETYGDNALLNALRRWNWKREGLAEEQGEDVIFNQEHVDLLKQSFRSVKLFPMGLLAMVKRALRGRLHQALPRTLFLTLREIDQWLLALAPPLKRYCGEVLVVAEGNRGAVSQRPEA
jgi:ubiquinone/menaquinone biosynthesis C-methylase UbiE